MAHLHPLPFGVLVSRMFRELDHHDSIFDLPRRKFYLGSPDHDLSVRFQGHRAASPLGPAAGPQSQMAQNMVLSWLGGCRIFELKTVQILDELEIPRPCIDMQTVGYNVEWSQELKLEQSLEEYVKGSMLIEILRASGRLPLVDQFDSVVYDMSVGYDLKGIQSRRVGDFIRGMIDARAVVERIRRQIPEEYAEFRDLDFPTRLSDTLTLSTFHGCPPDEIERIIDFLLREFRLHCIVKLNPTLLGSETVHEILQGKLGYEELAVPEAAFEKDTTWEQAQGFVERLGETATSLGLGFGVKFTNTLIVENHRDFFPAAEKEMYLSGPPLHVLAMHLVRQFRSRFGDRFPISFSAGIDRGNFADAVALGLVPITVCSDLLKPGGYGRAEAYFRELQKRMDSSGASSVDGYIERAFGCEPGSSVSDAKLFNTEAYVLTLSDDPKYARQGNNKIPKKVGSHLELFDCLTCDKCVPVCPNDANFTFEIPKAEIRVRKLRREALGWKAYEHETLRIEMKHQIGNLADLCNECGNCDIFCPEDGGPYLIKPRFFATFEQWRKHSGLDGFYFERGSHGDSIHGRFQGHEYQVTSNGGSRVEYSGPSFSLAFDPEFPEAEVIGSSDEEVDLTYMHILMLVRDSVWSENLASYLSYL